MGLVLADAVGLTSEFLCSNLRLRERVQLSQHIEIGSEVGYECVLAWPGPLRTANQNL